jgi:thiamine-phosphate pyrophosphorylase
MLLCAITSRRLLPGRETERQAALAALARGWAEGGVDYIQIREKDLPSPDLLALARRIVAAVRETGSSTRVLLNGPAEIALESGADGVHLPSSAPDGASGEARNLYRSAGREAVISRACHFIEEAGAIEEAGIIEEAGVVEGAGQGASLIVFAPVFEKVSESEAQKGVGLDILSAVCRAAGSIPVLALGGVTPENAAFCIAAGAAGVAGFRLFLDEGWRALR